MVSFLISDIGNPGVVSESGSFTIEVLTGTGYVIDKQGDLKTSFSDALANDVC
jgi:hypothetical protein